MEQGRNGTGVHLAVVGAGYWGKNLVRNFYQLGALSLVCDSNPGVEQDCQRQYPGVKFCTRFAEALADASIRAVALATPAMTHYQLARAALEAGKDVFVEKPLSLETTQGLELVELAEKRGRILMVGHILRYHPAVLKLQELIQKQALGELQYVYSNRLNIGKIRTEENILWSFAPHDISVMLALLGEMPQRVCSRGGAYLNKLVADVTLSQLEFPNGVQAHVFVSWLHPVKEQRLVVVASEKMAVFDDTAEHKLMLYPHKVEWNKGVPTALKANGEIVPLEQKEPLRAECAHFLQCVETRATPVTDGREGLRVLEVLEACQRSLLRGGEVILMGQGTAVRGPRPYFVHETAVVEEGAEIGDGSKIWHFSHVMRGAVMGKRCILGQNVNVDGRTVIGNNVKIQNNVSVYTGVIIEDDVFLGPSCVLTNVTNPRAQVNRHSLYETTRLKRGCTVGANATIVCGITVGAYAFVAAGAVVTKDVPDYALVMGNPARQTGWVSRHGQRLGAPDAQGIMRCPEYGYRYTETAPGVLRCLDLDENAPLPSEAAMGVKSYRELRSREELIENTTVGSQSAIRVDSARA